MTMARSCVPLRDLLVATQRWDGRDPIEVDCYDADGFAGGVPVVRPGDAVGDDLQRVQPGDVLLSLPGQAPQRTWVVGESRGRPQLASARWWVLRSASLEPSYARHLLVSNDFRRRLGAASGRPALAAVTLTLPGIEQQRRIGRLLDQADALRRKRALVLRNAGEIVGALFAGSSGGTPPEGLARLPLSELLTEVPRHGIDVDLASRGAFPVLRPADVRAGRVSFAQARYVSHSDAALARTALADGDVLLACDPARGDVRCALARPGASVWFLHARLWRLRTDPQRLCPEYLHAWLLSPHGRRCVLQAWRSDRRVPVETRLAGIMLALPPIGRQRAFADAVNAVERLEARLHASAGRLDELLGTLRDLAFRGELDPV